MIKKCTVLLGLLVFLEIVMVWPSRIFAMTLKMPSEMSGYQVKVMNEQGECAEIGHLDARGEISISREQAESMQIMVEKDRPASLSSKTEQSRLKQLKENATGYLVAFIIGGLTVRHCFRKKYREAFELIYDSEIDN